LQRLKSKLGNRSNASSEVEFDGAWARMIGEECRGVQTIIEMVHHTRLDCVMGSASLMRRALMEAVHHARHRRTFGRALIDQPAMQAVLADLALESEAATLLLLRLARAFDEGDRAFARLGVAVGKFWTAKRTPVFVAEALECLGGNGFVEESPMPRLYREAPLNSIWEGSGNVIALDVLRTIAKEPGAVESTLAEVRACGDKRVLDAAAKIEADLHRGVGEQDARSIAERLAIALQASLVVRFSPPALASAFCATRLTGDWGRTFGTLPRTLDVTELVGWLDAAR
jgi:putative acyl-CoA dehydrogenase